MPEILRMPEVAANVTEALLAAWIVPVGGQFSAGDALVTVETDKAAVDVEAESGGVVLRQLVGEGTQVEVGSPIAVFGAVGESADLDAFLAGMGIGAAAQPEPPSPPAAAPTAAPTSAPASTRNGHSRTFASPLARRLARDARVELDGLTGTGPGGRIRRRDVEAYLSAAPDAAAPTGVPVPATAQRPAAAVPVTASADHVAIPHSRMRLAIASRLTASKQTTPHFYLRGSARVDRLLALRQEINAADGQHVSVNDLVVKAVARAHTMVPALNVVWTEDAVLQYSRVDVAVAVATEHGLVTPVVRDVDRLSLGRLSGITRDLAARAKDKRIQPSELDGGTITVTNLGMFGTEEFAAIINPPQAAILAVGAARAEPVVSDGAVEVATLLRLTLSVDHRAVDGAVAAGWMRVFLELLENPLRVLV